jgi:hypothetical protein
VENVEAFDVTIPEGWDGKYSVWVGYPKDSKGCEGTGIEPFAFAATWWK